jgi:group I intron endonuclease
MISGIYKITNPKGQVYIGLSKNIHQRWRNYKHLGSTSQGKIKDSILKHGYSKHQFDILEQCDSADLAVKEIEYKQKFINEYGWDKALFMAIDDYAGFEHRDRYIDRQKRVEKAELMEAKRHRDNVMKHFMRGTMESVLYG